jgi:prepilin-type N-terminal cleavage/methylation domain-containing protein
MKKRSRGLEHGFSLVEVLLVLLILGVVSGALLQQVAIVQQRASTEQLKVDDFQQARDFVDQFFRDINQAGYPNLHMVDTSSASWSPALYQQTTYGWASKYINDGRLAVGLVKIDATEIRFEGDANGDGNIESIIYKVNGSGTCSLCLQRSQADKAANGDPIAGQTQNWGTEVNDVVNGSAIFTYFKADGTKVTALPVDYTTSGGAQTLASIKTIQISLTVRNNNVVDPRTRQPIETSFEGEVSLNNCNMGASGQAMSCN